jgi:hypothetical protein
MKDIWLREFKYMAEFPCDPPPPHFDGRNSPPQPIQPSEASISRSQYNSFQLSSFLKLFGTEKFCCFSPLFVEKNVSQSAI